MARPTRANVPPPGANPSTDSPSNAVPSARHGAPRTVLSDPVREALEHIEQGVSVVDADLRVIAWNQRFLTLLDVPADLFGPGSSFDDLVRYNALRGEYGEGDVETMIAERCGRLRAFRPLHIERTRPDGTVLEIVGAPVPGGGFVTTYSDVTARRTAERALRESEARNRMVIEAAHDAIAALDERGAVSGWNRRATALFGWTPREAIGRTLDELIFRPNARRAWRRALRRCERDSTGQRLELDACHRDGSTFTVELSVASAMRDGHRVYSAFMRDITERRLAEEKLRASEERFRTIIDQEPECVKMVARDGTLLDMNPAGLRMIEAESLDQVRGVCVYELVAPEFRPAFEALNSQVFEGEQVGLKFDIVGMRGTRRTMETTAAPLRDGEGRVTAQLSITRDVTEATRLAEQVHYQANHDLLTDLPNRNRFEERLEHVIDDALLHGNSHVLCFLDLDQFKVVNDTCGHVAGDELLKQLAAVLRPDVRADDLLARLGGDEFALLMTDCTLERGLEIIETVRRRIEEFRFTWNPAVFSVTASIGVVVIDPDCEGPSRVMSAVDAACYAAKEAGRNRVHVYDRDDSQLNRRHGEMQWVTRLQDALDGDRFELHVQPIVPVGDPRARATGHEVLVRMVNPDGSLATPGAFLPAAERYNLATRIDRWVVTHVLATLAHMDPADGALSVNLSAQSLSDGDLLDFIDRRLRGNVGLARRLCFEITETAAITDMQRAMRFIEKLRALGCRTALDDFGSGLSSFAYLRNIPVDYLKIDGMFVRDIVSDPIDRAMVRSIHEVGRLMGKKTVAEFVENDAILAILGDIGVDFAQGYAVGAPVPLRQAPVRAPGQAWPPDRRHA